MKGLVLFLSYATKAPTKPPQSLEPPLPVKPPLPVEEFFTHDVDGKETQLWTDLQKEIKTLTDALDGSIKNQGIWASFKRRNWRMPITAIGYQYLFELPRLSKIIVIASKDSCQGKGSGSARQFGFFKDRVEALCKAAEVELPEVKCLQPEGIDFEDCDAISRAVQEAKEYFREQKIGDYLVDITSGTALCSSTGAALTLDESEAFQYVSTNDYSVRKFDLEYEPRKETIHH